MNPRAAVNAKPDTVTLIKKDPTIPALIVTGRDTVAIRAGTQFGDRKFETNTPIEAPAGGYEAGCDYAVLIEASGSVAIKLSGPAIDPAMLGGFHFAPGGNATARAGGDSTPAINPFSCWDLNFRPACPNPAGMTLVEITNGVKFWCDIYLLGVDHLTDGTSKYGVMIADGNALPQNPGGGEYDGLDYETAVAVLKHHGKGLLSLDEFFAAAFGVKERSATGRDPSVTKLDAPRTSRWGVMQATGNLWVWGHDGDPDEPRPSIFGGSWFIGSAAGSRYAFLDIWPASSRGFLGARGRSDHLQLA